MKNPFAFKTRFGYVSAQDRGTIEANRNAIGGWEVFTAVPGKYPHTIAIRSVHGKFLTYNPGLSVMVNAPGVGENESFTPIKIDKTHIALKAHNGKIICIEGDKRAVANRDKVGEWETLTFEKQKQNSGPKIKKGTMKSTHGKFVSAQQDGRLVADRNEAKGWETFEFIKNGEWYNIKSAHGKFLSAQPDGRIVADRNEAKDWEKFQLIKKGGGKFNIMSFHKKFLSAQQDGRLVADRAEAKGWEEFEIRF
jgi:Fascin domain./FRG1-like family.